MLLLNNKYYQKFLKIFIIIVAVSCSYLKADCTCVITASTSSLYYNVANSTSGNGGFTFTLDADDNAEVYALKFIIDDSNNTPASGDVDGTLTSFGTSGLAAMSGSGSEAITVTQTTLASYADYATHFTEGARVTW